MMQNLHLELYLTKTSCSIVAGLTSTAVILQFTVGSTVASVITVADEPILQICTYSAIETGTLVTSETEVMSQNIITTRQGMIKPR